MALITAPQMFAILGLAQTERLGELLEAKYKGDYFQLSPSQWLLVAPGTAKEICDAMGITEGESGSAIVVAFTSYFGRANPQIWEWIASRLGAKIG